GELTTLGAQQMIQLGTILREEYIFKRKFISEQFDEKEVYIRSTDMQRTIHSAMYLLCSLFPNLNSTKVPVIHTVERPVEIMYPPPHNECERLKYLMSTRHQTPEYQHIKQSIRQVLRKLNKFMNRDDTENYYDRIWNNNIYNWFSTIECFL